MNILAWNVRGLHGLDKHRVLVDLIKDNDVGICGLVETKIALHNIDSVTKKIWGNWGYFHNGNTTTASRIIVGWNKQLWLATMVLNSSQLVVIDFLSTGSDVKLTLGFVYGSNKQTTRRLLWDEMRVVAAINREPICFLGDFNALRKPEDSFRVPNRWPAWMDEFNACINDTMLTDVKATGLRYTWSTRAYKRKIDRALVNEEWLSIYPNSEAKFMSHPTSDHTPILVNLGDTHITTPKPFKFFNYWAHVDGFKEVVMHAWAKEFEGTNMFRVSRKLKEVKENLKKWAIEYRKRTRDSLDRAKEDLERHQSIVDNSNLDSDWIIVKEKQQKIIGALMEEESAIAQKSRIHWLKEGDKNTAFFHKKLKIRQNLNRINSLTDDEGKEVKDEKDIGEMCSKFFENLFKRESNRDYGGLNRVKMFVEPIQSPDDGVMMDREVTAEEIRNTIFSLNSNKAPGPDGFNGFFFKHNWEIVGSDVTKAILEFFESNTLLKQMNTTILALIPKVKNPSGLGDFRPISCCNTLYKVIAKILANRLKPILPGYISENQSAFIEGRNISDNIFLAQELFHEYHTGKGASRVAIKVDIRKAYDTVRWAFIWDVLEAMKIPKRVIQWIRSCVTSASFSVSINGGLHGFFKSSRGLRQGDPLSPYLFVICMNVLSKMLNRRVEESGFSFHWRCAKLKLTHLSFADDLLLFSKSDGISCKILKDTLDEFEVLSGLHPNQAKSACYFANTDEAMKKNILEIMGYCEGMTPFRYLGVPLVTKGLKLNDCIPLIESLKGKINNWTTRFLSFAGRLTLINSVLFSANIFWCAHFILPSRVYKEIESIIRNFLWSGTSDNHRKVKVAWDEVAKPKSEGGLGIRRLKDMNIALMARWVKKIFDNKRHNLWTRWTHLYLIRKQTFWQMKKPAKCSWTWRKILEIRPLLVKFFHIKIGNGKKTMVWWDPWEYGGPIGGNDDKEMLEFAGLNPKAKVNDFVENGIFRWPENTPDWLRGSEGIMPNIQMEVEDEVIWHDQRDFVFSAKQVWESLRNKSEVCKWWKVIWKNPVSPRSSFTLWVASKNRLPTLDRLTRWGIQNDGKCVLCTNGLESLDHLFFECPFSKEVWLKFIHGLGSWANNKTWEDWLLWAAKTLISKRNKKKRLLFVLTIDTIWRERNRRRQNEGHRSTTAVCIYISSMADCIDPG